MSRSGSSGGAATLSSFRVQKAFSINFRENKRLLTEIRLIENEHIRNIRAVKQDIKDTRMWLEKVRGSSGRCPLGLRPDTEPGQKRKNKNLKTAPARSKTTVPIELRVELPVVAESDVSDDEDLIKRSEEAALQDAAGNDDKPTIKVRPWTEVGPAPNKGEDRHRATLKSQPAVTLSSVKNVSVQMQSGEPERGKDRVQSAASVHNSVVSLNVIQRRRRLQTMMTKKQHPLAYKREMIAGDNRRVSAKVNEYLGSLGRLMDIPMPDLTQWRAEETPREIIPFTMDEAIVS